MEKKSLDLSPQQIQVLLLALGEFEHEMFRALKTNDFGECFGLQAWKTCLVLQENLKNLCKEE